MAPGVFLLPQDQPTWLGAIHAMQTQASLKVHPGALTALSLQGMAHYIRSANEPLYIFLASETKLPRWFTNYDWQQPIKSYTTNFLPEGLAMVKHSNKTFSVDISSTERAMLECLYLAPDKMDIIECYHLMEGLVNLRPTVVQELLEVCQSIKVKRLFLYMAEKAGHAWFKYLDRNKLDLGSGDRMLVKNGVYNQSYGIIIHRELSEL